MIRTRALIGVLSAWVLLGMAACNRDDKQPERRYCDSTGCYACQGERCYPVPGTPTTPNPGMVTACGEDAACGAGRVCNLGRCEAVCQEDKNCQAGLSCVAGRCRPDGSASCGIGGAQCTADAQCGGGARCVNRACYKECGGGSCALGQVCTDGLCVDDPAPVAQAQCTFDYDCHAGKGGFRCINAYCLPTCADNAACKGTGLSCVKGVCRQDRRGSVG